MCPVCWINGILAMLFGASAVSFGTEWYIIIPSIVLTIWGIYKLWEGIKRGKHWSDEQKAAGRKTILRFIIGVVIGLYTGAVVVWMMMLPEHNRLHDLLEEHGIESHETCNVCSIDGTHKH